MNSGELMDMVTREAKRFAVDGPAGVKRNKHLCGDVELTNEQFDAVVVGFTNHLAFYLCGMDLAFHCGAMAETRKAEALALSSAGEEE